MATEIWWNAARSRMGDPVVRTVDIAIVVASVATMAGLGLAARRWYWTAIAIVVAVPEHLRSLVGWRRFQDLSQGQFHVVFIATGVVVLVSALVAATLVFVACRDVEPDDALVASGSSLRRIRLALYAMAVAPTLLVVCTVLLGNPTWTWPAHVAAMTLELLGLVVLALALLGTAELPRWLAIASAAIALCVAGHTLFSMASVVGAATIDWELIRLPDKLKPDLPSQLLASCAVGGVLVAIALAARRRGLDALRGRAMAMTVMFAALVLGALTAQHLVGNTSELTQLGAGLVLCASAAVIASYLVAAAVVRRGEHALASQASLPAAKLITC
ncbi:MAG TPA: hypothetical protein VMJ10_14725 [Kofleriaceae bacterium]|nr:hypothetical protein [Kofleriaceae bacterium]